MVLTDFFASELGQAVTALVGTVATYLVLALIQVIKSRINVERVGERYGVLFEYVTDAVFRAEVERNNGNLEEYAQREAETGRDRRLLYVVDLAQKWADANFKWNVSVDTIVNMIERAVQEQGLTSAPVQKVVEVTPVANSNLTVG